MAMMRRAARSSHFGGAYFMPVIIVPTWECGLDWLGHRVGA